MDKPSSNSRVIGRIGKKFHDESYYRVTESQGYKLLPIRFTKLSGSKYVVTNMVGEYLLVDREELEKLVEGSLAQTLPNYDKYKSHHFLYDNDSNVALDLLGLKYRSKLEQVAQFTSLHIFVVTLRCDYTCQYCQVSRQTEDRSAYDMTEEMADEALKIVFESPSPSIKIEFQGGEPLLNFGLIKYIVTKANLINVSEMRNLQFVITTNLSFVDDEILAFCLREGIYISTSLDGPESIHNRNRPRPGKDGYQKTVEGIRRVQETLGRDRISAVMTTTLTSLAEPERIIDEYVSHGFKSIFLRPLSPYGFAIKTGHISKYNTQRWLDFYKKGLDYIIDLNQRGYRLIEQYTAVVLRKMFLPQNPGYVDLQAPAGIGISVLVYNYDGTVYASDEARMLAEMGDKKFCLGNLKTHTYQEIMLNDTLLDSIESSINISSPMCSDCAFLPYCGSDPVYHYATQHDVVGNKALSSYCQKNMGIFKHIVSVLEDREDAKKTLMSWI